MIVGKENIENHPKTFNEKWEQDEKIRSRTLRTFGSNVLPAIQKLDFKVCLFFLPFIRIAVTVQTHINRKIS